MPVTQRSSDDLIIEVSKRLRFNEEAYGKTWTGEDEDTRFIVAPLRAEVERKESRIQELEGLLRTSRAERDHWKRMFNRIEASITHHKRACERNDVPDTHDESLWAARDRVLRDSATETLAEADCLAAEKRVLELMVAFGSARRLDDDTYELTERGTEHVLDFLRREAKNA